MSAAAPAATVFIPTWNAGPRLEAVLAAVRAQRVREGFEILAIDSGSTDGTAERLRTSPDIRLIEIPHSEFDHGLTRDLGIRSARAGIVVMLSQDAVPEGDTWLGRLLDCFHDARVAGAYSRQVPTPDAGPFIRDRLARWQPAAMQQVVQEVDAVERWNSLTGLEQLGLARFDNVSAAVRRDVALAIPFGPCRFGEDLRWGRNVVLAGYRIIYEPRSIVRHSHPYSAWYEFRRAYLDHHSRRITFGAGDEGGMLRMTAAALRDALHYFRIAAGDGSLAPLQRVRWCARALPFAFSQNLGRHLGTRSVQGLQQGSALYARLDRSFHRTA